MELSEKSFGMASGARGKSAGGVVRGKDQGLAPRPNNPTPNSNEKCKQVSVPTK